VEVVSAEARKRFHVYDREGFLAAYTNVKAACRQAAIGAYRHRQERHVYKMGPDAIATLVAAYSTQGLDITASVRERKLS
jgi:hypothetical protein